MDASSAVVQAVHPAFDGSLGWRFGRADGEFHNFRSKKKPRGAFRAKSLQNLPFQRGGGAKSAAFALQVGAAVARRFISGPPCCIVLNYST